MLSRFSRVSLLVTPWTVAHQAPLPMGFSRQEHWSGLPFPSPAYLIASPTCHGESLGWEAPLPAWVLLLLRERQAVKAQPCSFRATSLVLLLSQLWAPHAPVSLGSGSSPACGPLAAGSSVLCTPTPTHAHACAHAHPHTRFSPSSSPSHLPPHLPLAGVGGHYTYSLHCIWVVAQGRAGPWWTLLNGSQEQVGGLLTAGTEGEKGASEEGAGLLLLPSPLSSFLHRPLHHTRVSSHSGKGSGTRGGNPHFQTLEMMALNEGAHHPTVEFPVARKTLLNPQAFPWKAGRTSLSSEVLQPLRVLQTLWVF